MPITEKLASYLRNCNEIHMYVEYVKQTLTAFRFKFILQWAELWSYRYEKFIRHSIWA